MKKRLVAIIFACVITFAGCGGENTETTQQEEIQPIATTDPAVLWPDNQFEQVVYGTQEEAFGAALWRVYQEGILPEGDVLEYYNEEHAELNRFAVVDVDGDGKEELYIRWNQNVSAEGTKDIVLGFEDGIMHTELMEYSGVRFFANGMIEFDWADTQKLSGGFLPFIVYMYDEESDNYQFYGKVEAWDKNVAAQNSEGEPFPDRTDKDGDGVVFYIYTTEWDGYSAVKPVDMEALTKWRNKYLGDTTELSISFLEMTEENFEAQGYTKPESVTP